MSFIESKEKFDARVREITKRYQELKARQKELETEISKGEHFGALDTEILFSGDITKTSTKYLELKNELDAINAYVNKTESFGGVRALWMSDKELVEITNDFVEIVKSERENVKAQREKIEKQFEKVLKELKKVNALKQEIDNKRNTITDTLRIINEHTKAGVNINLKDYEFNNGVALHHIGLALKHYEKGVKK